MISPKIISKPGPNYPLSEIEPLCVMRNSRLLIHARYHKAVMKFVGGHLRPNPHNPCKCIQIGLIVSDFFSDQRNGNRHGTKCIQKALKHKMLKEFLILEVNTIFVDSLLKFDLSKPPI
uniref:Zinc finger protein 18 n=1 Tax=Lygus hesperus TaxID=30085 RepID=A0A0A9X040_LYGHE